ASMLGYTVAELMMKDYRDVYTVRGVEILLERSARRNRGEDVPSQYETVFKRKDGSEIDVEANVTIINYKGSTATFAAIRDISERKRIELEIQKQKQYFEALFASASDAIVSLDLNGNVVSVNPHFEKLFGYTQAEIREKNLDSFIVSEDGFQDASTITKTFQDGGITHFERKRKRQDGSFVDVSVGGAPIIVDGEHVGALAIYRDISERKRIEEALRKSEERYRRQFEEAIDAIFVANAETGILVDCNRRALELVGREKSELIGQHQRILYPPEGIEGDSSRTYKQHLAEKEGQILETQVITKRGEIRDVAIKASIFELEGQKVLLGIFRDITARKQAEKALRESEEKYRLIVENAYDGIEITQYDRIMFTNAQFAEMLGYTLAEIFDMEFSKFFTEQAIRELYERQKYRKSGKPESYQYETTFLKKDGSIIDVEIKYRIIDYNGEPATFAIIRDITERLSAEKARKQIEEALITTERIYRQAITKAGGVPYQIDYASRNYVFLGDGIESLTGYLPDEMTGLLFTSRLRQTEAYGEYKDLPRLKRDQLTLQGKIKEWREDDLFERKDGSLVWLADHSVPLFDNEGRTTGSLGILMDITERKQAEETLRVSEEQFRSIWESSRDGMRLYNADGIMMRVNPAFCQIIGKPESELVGKPLSVIYNVDSADHILAKNIERFRTGTIESHFERLVALHDGRSVWFGLSNSTVEIDGEKLQLSIFRDITARKRVEAERDKIITELREAINKVKTLSGLIPICASCKKIRDDQGYWSDVELYISKHSDAEFSHGLCNDCMKKLYPEQYDRLRAQGKLKGN
ncbi:MAG: PAS domain S-box protein, partial [Candidatus Zixiibacteriota bacterium]